MKTRGCPLIGLGLGLWRTSARGEARLVVVSNSSAGDVDLRLKRWCMDQWEAGLLSRCHGGLSLGGTQQAHSNTMAQEAGLGESHTR